jgi:RNA polymerase sigma factor (sigma-70 family)
LILALFDSVTLLGDDKLIERYKSTGNTWYVGELYKRYSIPVTAICLNYLKNREEAEDAVMEIFEIVMNDLLRQEIREFKPWVATVARHHCLRRKERKKKENNSQNEIRNNTSHFMELTEEFSLMIENSMPAKDIMEELQLAIAQLKPEQKVCLEMFYLQDISYQDICLKTGYNLNQVKSFIQNGKRNLKIYLESLNEGTR